MCDLDNEFGALTNITTMLQWFDLFGVANNLNFASFYNEQHERKVAILTWVSLERKLATGNIKLTNINFPHRYY